MPKKHKKLHILFISTILELAPGKQYTERELNAELSKWTDLFGGNFGLDHVTLRRSLIDEKYLTRDTAGGAYQLGTADLPYTFDDSIRELDLEAAVAEAREARELRKQQYMRKPQG